MPMFSPLQAFGQPSAMDRYGVKRLTSYGGYPVVSAKSVGLEDYYNKDGKVVAGMAWGGNKNPIGQGGGEKPSIVPNQNYFKNDPIGYNALVKLEASRHWMDENDYIPKFKITPQMKKWRDKTFKDIGPAAKAYLEDDNAFRQTIISRFIGGDSNIPTPTKELKEEIKNVQSKLESQESKNKPSTSEMIMKAVKLIPSLRK